MWLKNLGSVSHRFESLLDGTKAHSALGLQAAFLMPISQLPFSIRFFTLNDHSKPGEGKLSAGSRPFSTSPAFAETLDI
jgi:hypothetical protein